MSLLDLARRLPAARRVDAAGLASCAAWLWLAQASRQPTHVPVGVLLTVVAGAWLAMIGAFVATRTGGVSLRRVLAWALLFRAIGFAGAPVLEDDPYRYVWDGRSMALTGNPYADAPADHFSDPSVPEAFQAVLDRINHPMVPTIYGPVCQALFAAGYAIAPAELWPLEALLLVLDLLTLALLARLLGVAELLLYAWCPLLIQELAFTGHVDGAGICFLVAALLAARTGRDTTLGVALALATGVKLLALVAAPALLLRARPRATIAFAVTLAGLYLPFLLQGSSGGGSGLHAFLGAWEFNSTGFAVLAAGLGTQAARLAVALLFPGAYLAYLIPWLMRERMHPHGASEEALPRLDLVYAGFFVLSPVVNPWYLLWLLPFVAIRPSAWALSALAAVTLSYMHGLTLPDAGLLPYEHPVWLRPLEAGIVAATALGARLWEFRREQQLALVSATELEPRST